MKHMLKFVGDGWVDLPEGERKMKSEFERLEHHIRQREKRIKKMEDTLKEIKHELREWKKTKTIKYNELIKYHKEFTPTFSTSLSKNKKMNRNEESMSFYTSGNLSWTTEVRVNGKRKPVYIGTMKYVNEILDDIEGNYEHYDLIPHKNPKHELLIKTKIEELIIPLIRKELIELLDSTGSVDSFLEEKGNGKKYWEKLLKESPYYEERDPNREKPKKGKFIIYNPDTIYKKK
jgi:hypothetical protein